MSESLFKNTQRGSKRPGKQHRQPASTIANISTRNLPSKKTTFYDFSFFYINLMISNKNNLYFYLNRKTDRNCATLLRQAKKKYIEVG